MMLLGGSINRQVAQQMVWPVSPRNAPTGPGSRGGQWPDPEFRKAYHRAWKAAHPEYRERERARRRVSRGLDPADTGRILGSLPMAAGPCSACGDPMIYVCGFCREGL